MAGTMRERTPGHWQLRAFAGKDPVTGKPRQVARTFVGGKRDAERELAKLVTQATDGHFDGTKATVGQLLDRWLAFIEPNRAPKTIEEYRGKINGRILPALEDVRLDRLRADRLDALYSAWMAEGLSPTTVHHLHAILSAALNQAVKWGWINVAPTTRATAPPNRPKPMAVPSPEDLNKLYLAAQEEESVLATAIGLAALTGMRRGELCALRWSDVDIPRGRLTIARAISVVKGRVVEGGTKTHQVRVLALDPMALKVLRERWEAMRDLSNRVGSPLVDDPYVISYNADGGRVVYPSTLSHRFGVLVKRFGWSYRFHDLRHFSATQLLAAGVDLKTVQGRHGWATATMALDRYGHALPELDREAAGVLGRALGG